MNTYSLKHTLCAEIPTQVNIPSEDDSRMNGGLPSTIREYLCKIALKTVQTVKNKIRKVESIDRNPLNCHLF